jgi:hypothetical protein
MFNAPVPDNPIPMRAPRNFATSTPGSQIHLNWVNTTTFPAVIYLNTSLDGGSTWSGDVNIGSVPLTTYNTGNGYHANTWFIFKLRYYYSGLYSAYTSDLTYFYAPAQPSNVVFHAYTPPPPVIVPENIDFDNDNPFEVNYHISWSPYSDTNDGSVAGSSIGNNVQPPGPFGNTSASIYFSHPSAMNHSSTVTVP